jgi:hypothetical protein
LTVSSKTVADYFKEKMESVVSKPSGFETMTDEAPRGGIGSRLGVRNEAEEDRGLCGSLGMGLLAKMSTSGAVAETFTPDEAPGGKEKQKEGKNGGRRCGDDNEGEIHHKSKKKGKKRKQVASD